MSQLPPGFVLDQQPAQAGGLPSGFVLDQPAALEAPQPEKPFLQSAGEAVTDATQLLNQGLSVGFGDELFAAGMTPFEMARGAIRGTDEGKGFGDRISDAYGRALEFNRNIDASARERSPVASTIGEVVGGAVTGAGLAKGGVTLLNAAKPTAASMVGRGAAEGAAYGGLYGAGTGEGFEGRATGAAKGAVGGAVTGGAIGAIGARMVNSAAAKAVPSLDDLKTQANSAYKAAEDAGVVVDPFRFRQVVDDMFTTLANEGIDPTLHPGVTAAFKRLDEVAGTPVAFQTLDILRRVSNAARGSVSPDERRLASILVDKIDDFMGNLKPSDVITGNGAAAGQSIKTARGLWTRLRKGEMIEELIVRAENRASQFSGSGYENALRTEFRNLVQNKAKMRGFNKTEQAALRHVARGGVVENILRMIGKFAPTGVVSSALSGGTGFAVAGPAGAVALPAIGFAARRGATALTQGNADRAGRIMRAGGQINPQQLTPAQRAALDAAISTQPAVQNQLGIQPRPRGNVTVRPYR